MAGVLVFADQKNGTYKQVIYEMLGLGKKAAEHLGQELQAVVIGKGVDNYVAPLAEAGVDKIFVINNDQLESYTTDGYSKGLTEKLKNGKPPQLARPRAGGGDPPPQLPIREEGGGEGMFGV